MRENQLWNSFVNRDPWHLFARKAAQKMMCADSTVSQKWIPLLLCSKCQSKTVSSYFRSDSSAGWPRSWSTTGWGEWWATTSAHMERHSGICACTVGIRHQAILCQTVDSSFDQGCETNKWRDELFDWVSFCCTCYTSDWIGCTAFSNKIMWSVDIESKAISVINFIETESISTI